MTEIQKILVPLDDSKNATRALDMAISIAGSTGAKITLVHSVYEPSRDEFKNPRLVTLKIPQDATKIIKEAQKHLEKASIPFESSILTGDVGYNIIKLAHSKSEKFDMIVIGSKGKGIFKKILFGSVSNHVIHTSKIPVLIVK